MTLLTVSLSAVSVLLDALDVTLDIATDSPALRVLASDDADGLMSLSDCRVLNWTRGEGLMTRLETRFTLDLLCNSLLDGCWT